jgi:hypothetical protein
MGAFQVPTISIGKITTIDNKPVGFEGKGAAGRHKDIFWPLSANIYRLDVLSNE